MSGWRNNLLAQTWSRYALWALGALMAGCAPRDSSTPILQTLRIAQRNEPATLDPHLATLPDEFFIIRALCEGLVTPDPAGGRPLPAAASRWEQSTDHRQWIFHLNPAARWSNGDPVVAEDFVFSIRRALTPANAAPKAPLFFALRNAAAFYRGQLADFAQVGLVAPDPHTLVITLVQPDPDFLERAASGPWIPVHPASVLRLGRDWTKPGSFVGNGPYRLTEWKPNQRITVQRNPHYHDAAAAQLDEIQFLAFDSGDTEEKAFRAGQIDVTMSVPTTKVEAYRREEPSPLRFVPLQETRYLALNTTRAPLSDVRVRRALSLALDRTALAAKVLRNGQKPAFAFIPEGLGGYRASEALHEDADEARRLLAEAGFPEGRGIPKLELSTWGAGATVLEAIQQRWRRELGIEVTLLQREARTHLAALSAGDFDLGFVTAIPDYNSAVDLLARFTTGHAENYARWHSAPFDAALAQANGAGAQTAHGLLLDQLPVIPLYFNTKTCLVRPRVHGWQEDALWTRFYKNVTLEKP